jgi:mycothiol system anti-sigma-R factor
MSEHKQCKETLEKLQTFLDRELSDDDVGVVRFHLDRCPPCLQLFHFEERWRRLVKVRACTETAPPSLRAQILSRAKQKSM